MNDWREEAACRGMGPDQFFLTRGGGDYDRGKHPAKKICEGCPVRLECLDYSYTLPFPQREYGVWGGMTGTERRNYKRRQQRLGRDLGGAA